MTNKFKIKLITPTEHKNKVKPSKIEKKKNFLTEKCFLKINFKKNTHLSFYPIRRHKRT